MIFDGMVRMNSKQEDTFTGGDPTCTQMYNWIGIFALCSIRPTKNVYSYISKPITQLQHAWRQQQLLVVAKLAQLQQ